jgi:hypothetical protein
MQAVAMNVYRRKFSEAGFLNNALYGRVAFCRNKLWAMPQMALNPMYAITEAHLHARVATDRRIFWMSRVRTKVRTALTFVRATRRTPSESAQSHDAQLRPIHARRAASVCHDQDIAEPRDSR